MQRERNALVAVQEVREQPLRLAPQLFRNVTSSPVRITLPRNGTSTPAR
ncbi:hypothetical protein ACSHWB_26590 [Lentzea sp. HUAS TT2]